ncbi:NAD(P)H-quinone oxidoreductase [Candidatus Nanopelagicales bacterium]|nr:NAD(P)H-quinone oxidoreductase [Candidatus Nanopelagicales bacterium]
MDAVVVLPDEAHSLEIQPTADPMPQAQQVVIEVAAAGVNRADLLQRQGHYPPPAGASEILGLECSGVVREVGIGVTRWQVGDKVCALLDGGGYATRVAVHEAQVMPVPEGVDLITAAALPEVCCTVMSNVSMAARLQACETLLVHGGGSGVGSMAVQWGHALGARVVATVGSQEKSAAVLDLGASCVINYKESDFVTLIDEFTQGQGADVILDIIGAKYLDRNVQALAQDGRLIVIGLQGGTKAELNLARLLAKRAAIHATSLRFRPVAQKSDICAEVVSRMWPLFGSDRLRPVVDQILPLGQAGRAQEALSNGAVLGKILLSA